MDDKVIGKTATIEDKVSGQQPKEQSKFAPKHLYDKCIGKVKKLKENGKSLRYISRYFSVSPTTMIRWYEKAGFYEQKPMQEQKMRIEKKAEHAEKAQPYSVTEEKLTIPRPEKIEYNIEKPRLEKCLDSRYFQLGQLIISGYANSNLKFREK